MAETVTRDGGAQLLGAAPSASRKEEASLATPMIAQYLEIKAANADCLLFYRMGDFYELFFEDAEIASRALGIALTKRGKHLGADIRTACCSTAWAISTSCSLTTRSRRRRRSTSL